MLSFSVRTGNRILKKNEDSASVKPARPSLLLRPQPFSLLITLHTAFRAPTARENQHSDGSPPLAPLGIAVFTNRPNAEALSVNLTQGRHETGQRKDIRSLTYFKKCKTIKNSGSQRTGAG